MKITATVKWRGITMDVTWEDGVLGGDKDAIGILSLVDPAAFMPAVPPEGYDTPERCPWAFANMLADTFDEVLSMEGLETMPAGDIIGAPVAA